MGNMAKAEKRYSKADAQAIINGLLSDEGYSDVTLSFERTAVHITNSYKVKSRDLRMRICSILSETEGFSQSAGELSAEWLGHNMFNSVIKNRGTMHADLEYSGDPRRPIRLLSSIMNRLGLH